MENTRLREPRVNELLHLFPIELGPVAASGEYPPPASGNLSSEGHKCLRIGWHCMVVEVAAHDVVQPRPLIGDRLVHAPAHVLLNHLELRPHAVRSGLPLD